MTRGRTSGELYLLGYAFTDSLMHIKYSSDYGEHFTDHILDASIQTPGTVQYKMLAFSEGLVNILAYHFDPFYYTFYRSTNFGENFNLLCSIPTAINARIRMVPVFDSNVDFIMEKYSSNMVYPEVLYSISSDGGVSFQVIADYIFNTPHITPQYVVPIPADTLIQATANSASIGVRSNTTWQISYNSNWILSISQLSGTGHQDITVQISPNTTGADRTANLTFSGNGVADTTLTIIQSGALSNGDNFEYQTEIEISPSIPNPFSDYTSLCYKLGQDTDIEISVYNIKGQRVKTISEGIMKKGSYTASWNGNDQLGKPCRSGIYFVKLIGNGKRLSLSKLTLLR